MLLGLEGSHSEKYLLFKRLKMHPAAAGCMKRLSGIIYDLFQVVFTAKMSPFTLARSDLQGAGGNTWLQPRHFNWIYTPQLFPDSPQKYHIPNLSRWWQLKYVLCSPRKLGFFVIQFDLRIYFFRWVETEPATSCILLVGSFGWFPWCWSNELPWLKEGCNMEMKHIWDRSNEKWDDYIRWCFFTIYRDFS